MTGLNVNSVLKINSQVSERWIIVAPASQSVNTFDEIFCDKIRFKKQMQNYKAPIFSH